MVAVRKLAAIFLQQKQKRMTAGFPIQDRKNRHGRDRKSESKEMKARR